MPRHVCQSPIKPLALPGFQLQRTTLWHTVLYENCSPSLTHTHTHTHTPTPTHPHPHPHTPTPTPTPTHTHTHTNTHTHTHGETHLKKTQTRTCSVLLNIAGTTSSSSCATSDEIQERLNQNGWSKSVSDWYVDLGIALSTKYRFGYALSICTGTMASAEIPF